MAKVRFFARCIGLVFLSAIYTNELQAQQVKISGFTNIMLTSWTGTGDLFDVNNLCIYNGSTANYRVRARGGGTGNSFKLAGSSTDISYEVRFKESAGSYVSLTADTFQNFTGANTTDVTCGGVANANFEVRVTEAALSAAGAGNYSGTLTILLETR
jgi:hypothetical protein